MSKKHFEPCISCDSDDIQIGFVELVCGECHHTMKQRHPLIEAAPELLTALEKMSPAVDMVLKEMNGKGVIDWGYLNTALVEASTAIKKAKGENTDGM